MDRFETIHTFIRVVDTGSLSLTAEKMNIAKSVVSRRISELESYLGVQLLNRTTRRISLTDAGRNYYERTKRVLAELEEAEQTVSSEHATLKGTLRIAAPVSFGIHHLAPLLDKFMLQHPELNIDLSLDDRTINLIEEGVDLAIRIGMLADSTLVARRLAPVKMVVCASPYYLLKHGEPVHPEELKHHLALNYSNLPENQLWQFKLANGNQIGVRMTVRYRANNGDVLLQAAIDGLGVLISPDFICHQSIVNNQLKPILKQFPQPDVNVYAVYPEQRHLPQRVRTLIDFLLHELGDRPGWQIL